MEEHQQQQQQQFDTGHEFQDPAHIQFIKMQYHHMEQLKLQQQQVNYTCICIIYSFM